MYETFEHTADLGLRIRASELNALFEDAARGLFSAIVANPDSIRPVQEVILRIDETQPDVLLHDWLAELLYTFDARRLLLFWFEVRTHGTGLTAVVRGEPIDRSRHQLALEVKAVTYHGLRVQHDGTEWLAEVILDI